jgi:aerobic C4-dicarboxylate transport protein
MGERKPWWRILYLQVILAILLGVLVGALWPKTGAALKPLGDAFIALIKMMIAPVIFCTVVHGIGSMRDLAKVGRIGVKALVYFEVVSTLALITGLVVGHVVNPGRGFVAGPGAFGPSKAVEGYIARAHEDGVVGHLMAIIPQTFFDAFAKGDLLQILLVAILTGIAVGRMGEAGEKVVAGLELAGKVFFRIIGILVHLAPIGAFGAMAYTVGAFGIGSLVNLAQLVATFYLTAIVFVLVVLGGVARLCGFSILRFIAYIREELLIVLGTSSSETALPGMIRKLETLGASPSVVGLVIPTGYSFNLDGTNIYMTLAILFLAQITHTDLTFAEQATILLIAMLTSKGASGVTGAGFVTLAATLAIVPDIPIAALGVLLGVDRFMSECRALTNLVGNGVATLVVARWEGELDREALARELAGGSPSQAQMDAKDAA